MFLVDQNGKHDKLLLRSNGPNIKKCFIAWNWNKLGSTLGPLIHPPLFTPLNGDGFSVDVQRYRDTALIHPSFPFLPGPRGYIYIYQLYCCYCQQIFPCCPNIRIYIYTIFSEVGIVATMCNKYPQLPMIHVCWYTMWIHVGIPTIPNNCHGNAQISIPMISSCWHTMEQRSPPFCRIAVDLHSFGEVQHLLGTMGIQSLQKLGYVNYGRSMVEVWFTYS